MVQQPTDWKLNREELPRSGLCVPACSCVPSLGTEACACIAEGLMNQHLPTVASASRLWAAHSSM